MFPKLFSIGSFYLPTYGVMVALVGWANMPEVGASSVGFLAGACVKYPLNYWTVFASRQRHRIAMPRFVLALAVRSIEVRA